MPIFNAAVDVQHGVVVPGSVVRLVREIIPVILVAARPIHHVDTGSATQHFAHRHGKGAPIDSGIWFSLKAPVPFGSEIGEPLIGVP